MNANPAVIQQGAVGQNGNDVVLYDLAVVYELAGWGIAQACFLDMKAPGSDSGRDEKITGKMSPGGDLGRFACACLHVEDYHSCSLGLRVYVALSGLDSFIQVPTLTASRSLAFRVGSIISRHLALGPSRGRN